jgi:hypothetical protein
MKEYTTVAVERGLALHGGVRSSISTMLNDLSSEGWEVVQCLPSFDIDGYVILEREQVPVPLVEETRMIPKNPRAAFEAHEAEKYDGERQNGEHSTGRETSWLEEKEKEESNDGEE